MSHCEIHDIVNLVVNIFDGYWPFYYWDEIGDYLVICVSRGYVFRRDVP